MADTLVQSYKLLFSVCLFHHYFLDDGHNVFLFDPNLKQPQLSGYDVKNFLKIMPTNATEKILKNQKMLFRSTTLGFVVLAPKDAPINETLAFAVVPNDMFFANYTTLTLKGQPIKTFDYVEEGEMKHFRVKQNVFVLTNQNPVNNLYLSAKTAVRPNDKEDYQIEEIFQEGGGGIYQAIADNAGSNLREQLKEPLPVGFISSVEIPKENKHGFDFQGVELSEEVPDGVFAVIRINTQTAHFAGNPHPPVFEAHFKNRSTEWRYYNKQSKQFEPQFPPFWEPLTARARLDKRKAVPDVIKIEKNNAGEILKLFSEINP